MKSLIFLFVFSVSAIVAAPGSRGVKYVEKLSVNPFADKLKAHKDLVRKLYETEKLHETTGGVNWAVVVAGSNGWYNYRHQADACHAYQIFSSHGIPDERIIVFMYDDLANNSENPTPGIVINQPNGTDVYHGVLKDYIGDDVTPENFVAALTGDSETLKNVGSGKVLKSGPKDHVFVNFADHGAPGLIAFPYGTLSARKLNAAIKKMHEQEMYDKMVFYIEACESGSMFEDLLPDNIDVYATTAANAEESSYACYFDDARGTYLGDVYSVKWMEDTDAHDIFSETLDEQFENVKAETTTSHVMEYGNLAMSKSMFVGEFQGSTNSPIKAAKDMPIDATPQGDAPLSILKRKYMNAKSDAAKLLAKIELDAMMQKRQFIVDTIHSIVKHVTRGNIETHEIIGARRPLTNNHECYEKIIDVFHVKCFNLGQTDYALRHLYNFVNLCDSGIKAEDTILSITKIC